MSETKKSKPVKKERATSYVVNILFALAAVVLIANCFSLFSQVKEKKDKYNSLERLYQEELVLKSDMSIFLMKKISLNILKE